MYYYFKNKKLTKFNDNVIVIQDTEIDGEFCLDEVGYNLLIALNEPAELKGDVLYVGKSTINTYNQQAPVINHNKLWETTIDAEQLNIACNFADKSSNRQPILKGININSSGSVIATDGFKIFSYKYANANFNATLSVDFCKELHGTPTIEISENLACVKTEDSVIYGKLFTGTYPEINRLLLLTGTTYDIPAELSQYLNLSTLTQASKIKFENGTISSSSEIAKFCKNIDLDIIACFYIEILKIALKYALNCKIEYISEFKPLIFKNDTTKILIMPCKEI